MNTTTYCLIKCPNVVKTDPIHKFTWWAITPYALLITSNRYFYSIKDAYEDALKHSKQLQSNVEFEFDETWNEMKTE